MQRVIYTGAGGTYSVHTHNSLMTHPSSQRLCYAKCSFTHMRMKYCLCRHTHRLTTMFALTVDSFDLPMKYVDIAASLHKWQEKWLHGPRYPSNSCKGQPCLDCDCHSIDLCRRRKPLVSDSSCLFDILVFSTCLLSFVQRWRLRF